MQGRGRSSYGDHPSASCAFARASGGRWRKKRRGGAENLSAQPRRSDGSSHITGARQILNGAEASNSMSRSWNALLKRAILRTKSVRGNIRCDGRHADQNRVGIHPPGEPGFQLWLAPKLIHQVTIIIEHGAVCNHMRRTSGRVQFRGNLRVQIHSWPSMVVAAFTGNGDCRALPSPARRCSGPSSAANIFHTPEWFLPTPCVPISASFKSVFLSPAALPFLAYFRRAENGGSETVLAVSASTIRNFARIVFELRGA